MTDSHVASTVVPAGLSRAFRHGWPLIAAGISIVLASLVGTPLTEGAATPLTEPALALLAISALTCGAVALIRAPDVTGGGAVIGVSAAAAALVFLGPRSQDPLQHSLLSFLVAGPWRFLITPIAVHLAFAIGWPHRHRYWFGVVVGWYLLHGAMWLAVAGGVAANEAPLVEALDAMFRRIVLEPVGAIVTLAALGIAAVSPARRVGERRASAWALAAVLLGLLPLLFMEQIAATESTGFDSLRLVQLALMALPVLSLVGLLSLPFIDPSMRDSLALAAAQRVLDEPDVSTALQALASEIREEFDAEGVFIRMAHGGATASSGKVRSGADHLSMTIDAETSDDRRVLLAPIGRSGDPLGEVRLEARHSGAYGRREREWLVAYLVPVSTALRARQRESTLGERARELGAIAAGAASDMAAALRRLPEAPHDDGMAVPPPVDAREVLSQLAEGITRVSVRGEDLEQQSMVTRDRVRRSSDRVAHALDALNSIADKVRQLTAHGDDINVSNQTVSGVAFRTNLLANNAALEATRAGSAGRTFGVLAEEIRRLADATASTSEAISARTASLEQDVRNVVAAVESITAALSDAISESEAGEDSARVLGAAAAELEGASRSLRPALEEARTVAERRSARDEHLTTMLGRFLDDRVALTRALTAHREAIDKVGGSLDRAAQQVVQRRQVGTLRSATN